MESFPKTPLDEQWVRLRGKPQSDQKPWEQRHQTWAARIGSKREHEKREKTVVEVISKHRGR